MDWGGEGAGGVVGVDGWKAEKMAAQKANYAVLKRDGGEKQFGNRRISVRG